MVVVHFGPVGEPTGLLSIPRDLWVTIPNRGEDRINAAYAWGDLKNGDGVSLARRTVEENFGIRVDRMAVVDFTCFQAAVDAVGGIQVHVADRLVDDLYPVEPKGEGIAAFEPGPQLLSGERALQYVRIRSPDSDFARMRRQQQVVSAFASEVHDAGKVLRLVGALTRQCTGFGTDLSPADLMTLGTIAGSGREIKMRMINESMVSPTTLPNGAQVLLPHWERIRPVVAEVIPGRGG
jgi:LCP family protein required for cell wall assembly